MAKRLCAVTLAGGMNSLVANLVVSLKVPIRPSLLASTSAILPGDRVTLQGSERGQ